MKRYNVTALGELLIDFTENGISSQGNPIMEANPGGAPCNVLAMLQKLGQQTAFIGKVGDDHLGHLLADAVSAQGVAIEGLKFDANVPTTLAFVHTYEDGDRSFSFYRNPGADVMLTKDDIDADTIKASEIFHFGTLSMTHESVEEATRLAIEIAKQNGVLLSFDPNLRPPLWDSLETAKEKMRYGFSVCDILKISDDEILFYTGQTDIVAGAREIQNEFGIPLVCATLGKDGSYAFYKGSNSIVEVFGEPFINGDTIETTGAGDTFMGCTLDFVLRNQMAFRNGQLTAENLKEMLLRANAAASLVTTRRGALCVMPSLDEIADYLANYSKK